ncbi:unnamed protein product [Urochloa humidicola]
MVAGTRPQVSRAQVELYLQEHFQLGLEDAEVRLYHPDDFLIVFRRRIDADRVLHAEHPANAPFRLTFRRWRREARANASPLLFKVLLELRVVPAHLWEVDIAQRIVGSSCLIIQAAPEVTSRRNMRVFTVAAWAVDPDLVSRNVVLVVPEKEPPFTSGNLLLRPEEIIHSSRATLRYRVSVRVCEVQDWHQADSSSGEDGRRGGGDSDDDDDSDPGFHPGARRGGSFRPWPRRHRFPPGGDGGNGSAWPTARGCDSALGWWGHRAEFIDRSAPCSRGGWCGERRSSEEDDRRRRPAPRRARSRPRRAPRRRKVWVARSNGRQGEVSGAEKEKQKSPVKAREAEVVADPDDFSAVAAMSVSVDPGMDNTDGTKGPHSCPLEPGLVEKDLFCLHVEQGSPPQRWDPMQLEASSVRPRPQAAITVPVGMAFERILDALGPAGPRRDSGPVFEAITFDDVRPVQMDRPQVQDVHDLQQEGEPMLPPCSLAQGVAWPSPGTIPLPGTVPPPPPPVPSFSGSGSPDAAPFLVSPASRRNITTTRGSPPRSGEEPLSATEFADLCSRPLPEPIIMISPPRRRPRQLFRESLLPRRSPRLAMKSRGRVSNPLVAAQNVLMRKLGIITEEVEPDARAVQQYSELCASGLSDANAEAIDELFPEHIPENDELGDEEELQELQ